MVKNGSDCTHFNFRGVRGIRGIQRVRRFLGLLLCLGQSIRHISAHLRP